MREDHFHIGITGCSTTEKHVGNCTCRVGLPFNGGIGHIGQQRLAAIGADRVSKYHSVTPVEFFEYRIENRVTQPLVAVIGIHGNAIGFERIQCVFDLTQSRVDVRHRQKRHQPESSRVILGKTRTKFIGGSGNAINQLRVVVRRYGDHGGCNTVFFHRVQMLCC